MPMACSDSCTFCGSFCIYGIALFLQMVSAQTGSVFDSFMLTKPVGWAFNATARASLVSGFIPTYQETLGQRYGYIGAGAATKAILAVVYENPQLFTGLANATLVQDINVMDTLASTLEVQFCLARTSFLGALHSICIVLFVLCLCCFLAVLLREPHCLPAMALYCFSTV